MCDRKIRFAVQFRDKPILDGNLNDSCPVVDRSDWYLNLVSDFVLDLANKLQIVVVRVSTQTNKGDSRRACS